MRNVRILLAALLSAACGAALAQPLPSGPSGYKPKEAAFGKHFMVAAANPLAVEAGRAVIARGGSALDAAVAVQMVLNVVEPEASGIGGGAFMLVYERATGALDAYDGRETAPAGATPDMFMEDGAQMNFLRAWQSGLSVGVPGAIALYEYAHERHGRLPMAENVSAAVTLADEGFVVSPRLAGFLEAIAGPSRLDDNPDTAAYFYPDGKPLAAGDLRDNPDYARTLRAFAAGGAATFYEGDLAEAIAAAAGAAPGPGGGAPRRRAAAAGCPRRRRGSGGRVPWVAYLGPGLL